MRSLTQVLILCLACSGSSADSMELPRQGRIVFLREDGVYVWALSSGESSRIFSSAHRYLTHPLWSSDGKLIAFMNQSRGGVRRQPGEESPWCRLSIIDPQGTIIREIPDMLPANEYFWLDERRLLIYRGGSCPKREKGGKRGVLLPGSHGFLGGWAVVDARAGAVDLEWHCATGGHGREHPIQTRTELIRYVRALPDATPAVFMSEGMQCCLKEAYPFYFPQRAGSQYRFVYTPINENESGTNLPSRHPRNLPGVLAEVVLLDGSVGRMFMDWSRGELSGESRPRWSPDGKWLAWSDGDSADGEVVRLLSGSPPNREQSLTTAGLNYRKSLVVMKGLITRKRMRGWEAGMAERYADPHWSPDSEYITCTHLKPGEKQWLGGIFGLTSESHIYIHHVRSGAGMDAMPGWDPDWK